MWKIKKLNWPAEADRYRMNWRNFSNSQEALTYVYTTGIPEEKRDLLKIVTSNREVDGKNLLLKLSLPFLEVANRFQNTKGAPNRDIPRTWDQLLQKVLNFFKTKTAAQVETR